MVLFTIVKYLIRFFLLFVFRIKVYGKENMPKEGGLIVVCNHRSFWDAVVLGGYSPRKLGFMAKAELFKNKIFGWLITSFGAFPVHRGKGDIGAIKAALSRLRENNVVAMFPEGRRVKNNEIPTAKPGAVMLASRAKVPIVPVKISGKYRWGGRIDVIIGEPVEYKEHYGEKLTVQELQGLSDKLLKTIYSLEVVS